MRFEKAFDGMEIGGVQFYNVIGWIQNGFKVGKSVEDLRQVVEEFEIVNGYVAHNFWGLGQVEFAREFLAGRKCVFENGGWVIMQGGFHGGYAVMFLESKFDSIRLS